MGRNEKSLGKTLRQCNGKAEDLGQNCLSQNLHPGLCLCSWSCEDVRRSLLML